MPISDYPSNWESIAQEIKAKANWQCEHCGHVHAPDLGRCLTVHHLDGDKTNCDYRNLVALCQVCHLHIQAVYIPGQLRLLERWPWAVKRGLM